MKIVLADVYGFCFGVRRAVDGVYEAAQSGKVVTLGAVTHNKRVVGEMAQTGIGVIKTVDEVEENTTVIIRAHGEPPTTYQQLEKANVPYIDLTCPIVAKNRQLAQEMKGKGYQIILTADPNHPEIVGINGWIDNSAIIITTPEQAEEMTWKPDTKYFLMSQTTFAIPPFKEIEKKLKNILNNLEINCTICRATADRQQAAENLAKSVDMVVVLGDKSSSNSKKLYEISKDIQKNTFFVETNEDLLLLNFSKCDIIGITAGASTPPNAIKEAIKLMSDFENTAPIENGENFEDMLKETMTTLHTGQVVTGKVISVVNGEVMVDLQYKSDGIIQRGQFAEDSTIDPTTIVSPGDEITVFILRVNDGDGNVLLSKKKVDAQKGYKDVDVAFASGEPLLGKVTEQVKGGLIANIGGVRVFVPSSQATARFTKDLGELVGQELMFNILELDKGKRPWRIIGGRKELAAKEAQEARDKALEGIEEGGKVSGPVTSIAAFGAFIDLGGVDGLIHLSELSWGRVKKVDEVLKIGDNVEAYVLKINRETGRVSLTLKSVENDPWAKILDRYPIGSIVIGKVVRMMPFGAFVELEEGIDGLVHISQIAHRHVKQPQDVLSIGQEVEVKIVEIDQEKRKISLSIKEALDMDYEDDYYDDDYDDEDYDDYDNSQEGGEAPSEDEAPSAE
ncbi:MAG: bifunctional 4-hydroxy-3-methylbut-2-enyl diphosphate reductase/30S ribosomal protein S1 [Defluviitaleaceae bacterium]|nr:bifunctional 4-hydroxy-3-methylbut-2-enyl diphosphate reductase/30S ribosomal protein S1 [Defluviitaleaceae bacterium]